MASRSALLSLFKPAARSISLAVDIVPLSARERALSVLLLRNPDSRGRERWMLPWDGLRGGESPDAAALRVARLAIGWAPAMVEQVGAFADGRRHPGDAEMSIGFVALVPGAEGVANVASRDSNGRDVTEPHWFTLTDLPALSPRQRSIVDGVARTVRARTDQSPLAFRLLPSTFTLSDLQAVYELLLGRGLHKASFRRALQAAFLVEPTDEWRSEGRDRRSSFATLHVVAAPRGGACASTYSMNSERTHSKRRARARANYEEPEALSARRRDCHVSNARASATLSAAMR
jgi:8-oxo-dGTP diphosphatase